MHPRSLARAHGAFNILSGAWPLVHMRSFEAVSGPKADRWLARTVAGLLVGNGAVQLSAGASADALAQARRIGLGTSATLGAVDAVYGGTGRISRVYLLDGLVQLGWLTAWAATGRPGGRSAR